ncbi:hypothetical protein RESH_05441 [Rhodopirellula europaea SH398]|uniref:Cytochrome c domain-containing protein n=2 Tax=Rhodopirellula TaxID=265488 RepID=M5RXG1_9BACT|nr:hypothetical protein RESH_05441 [Rhodopirellula europaea SH398]
MRPRVSFAGSLLPMIQPANHAMPSLSFSRRRRLLNGMLLICIAGWTYFLTTVPIALAKERADGERSPLISGVERFGRHDEIDSAATARLLVTELSCVACHRSQRSDLKPKLGPNLTAAGTRLRASWIKDFLHSPHETKPGTTMPDLLSNFDESEKTAAIDAIVAFLASCQQPYPELKAGGANPLEDEFWNKGDPDRGGDLYHQVGCVACHEPGEEVEVASSQSSAIDRLLDELDPEELEDMGLASAARKVDSVPHPELANKYTRQSLTHFLHDPEHIRPSGRMPSLKLTPNEAADIAEYLMQQNGALPKRIGDTTKDVTSSEQLIKRGKQLFGSLRCANCHDAGIKVQKSFATELQQLNVDSANSCLQDKNHLAVDFDLDDFQTEVLVRSIQSGELAEVESYAQTNELVQQRLLMLNCYACHERDQMGGVGRYRKPHFEANSLADLGDEGRLPPGLSGIGAKLTKDWLQKVLAGHPSTRLRPHMTIRMPKFPKTTVEALVKNFELADEATTKTDSDVFGEHVSLAEDGKQLTQIGCIQCHAFDGQALPGVVGIDLGGVPNRIRPDWFREFVLDPGALNRGTRMPSFFPDGVSQSPHVLDGDADQQVAALWSYLKQSGRLGVPPKIAEALAASYELKPEDHPLILRTFMSGVGTHAIAVGFPQGVHFAIDAKTPRLALAWKEDFVDARSTWFERFTPPIDPLGMDAVAVSPGAEFRFQPSDRSQEPSSPIFIGYRLDSKRIPTFRYRIGGTIVEDRNEASRDGKLHRTIRVASDGEPMDGELKFRLMVDTHIGSDESNRFMGASGLSVTVSDEDEVGKRTEQPGDTEEIWVSLSEDRTLEVVYQW